MENKNETACSCCNNSENENGISGIIKFISGAVIFSAGMIIEHFFNELISRRVLLAIFITAYIILGGNIVLRAFKNIAVDGFLELFLRARSSLTKVPYKNKTLGFFDENFLMTVATIGAFIIGQYPEAAGVMLFYQIGEMFQEKAVNKSRKSISALMDIRPDFANVRKGNELVRVAPEAVNIGDIIVVKPGEKIALDGEVTEGESSLDTRALTGESVPRRVRASDAVLSGCINLTGVLIIKVTKSFGQSTVAKILELVENTASQKAPTEKFITRFSRYYTPAVVGLAVMIACIPPLLGLGLWADWVNRGLIFLVISCPCALVVSIPLGFFGGIGSASRRGILVKGGNYLEALANLDMVVFDKTGTLTQGVFKVTEIINAYNFASEQVLEYAAKAELFSNHPIASAIRNAYGKEIDKKALKDYCENSGYGISVKADGKIILAGNYKLMTANGISCAEVQTTGTKVYVAQDNEYAGCIIISDEIKADSKAAIVALKKQGVHKTVMLTGDEPKIADAIARELELDEFYAGLLPHEKVEKVEMLSGQKQAKGKLAFVGDGINDAPVLARADIGIAMGGLGSDAAIEAADIVLMTDEISKLVEAIDVARFTKRIVWQNIVFALGIKAVFLVLGAFGLANMWEAVFADVGVALLAIMNATRVIKAGKTDLD